MGPTLGYIGHRPCLTQKRFTYAYRQFNSSASSLFALLVFSPEFLFSFVATFAHWLAHKVRVINLMFTRCNSSLITTIKLNQVNNGILTNREPGNNIYPPPLAVNKISPAQGHSADFILNWIWAWIRLIYNENAWYTCFECFAKKKKKKRTLYFCLIRINGIEKSVQWASIDLVFFASLMFGWQQITCFFRD